MCGDHVDGVDVGGLFEESYPVTVSDVSVVHVTDGVRASELVSNLGRNYKRNLDYIKAGGISNGQYLLYTTRESLEN